ncbi:MAG: aldo/keto reductase [Puniceicoccales bacterium]
MTATFTSNSSHTSKTIQGQSVPAIGFGTFQIPRDECHESIIEAVEVGYRHFDTAAVYDNERIIGQALQEIRIPREELFLSNKIWWEGLTQNELRTAVDERLRNLQTEYLDLALMLWPSPNDSIPRAIETLNSLKEQGKIRHLGLSNFTHSLFQEAARYGTLFTNQIEYNLFHDYRKFAPVYREHGTALTAYSPLNSEEPLGYPALQKIASKHGKETEQVALRWLIEQEGVLAIPRSSKRRYIQTNFNIFDFSLDEEDYRELHATCVAQGTPEIPTNDDSVSGQF